METYVRFKISLKIGLDMMDMILLQALHEIFMKIYLQCQ